MDLKIKSKFFNQEDVVEVDDKEINPIIENAIQADKDILSKITVEYDETNDKTIVTFPPKIYPLQVSGKPDMVTPKYFIKLESGPKVVNNSGVVQGNLAYLYNTQQYKFEFSGNVTNKFPASQVYYILFDSPYMDVIESYYLYHPVTESGTKLYKHTLDIEVSSPSYDVISLLFYSKYNQTITDVDDLIAYFVQPSSDGGFVPDLISMMFGYQAKVLSIYLNRLTNELELVILNNGSTTLTSLNIALTVATFTDTVTPL